MNIKTSGSSVEITGDIKHVSDFQEIKSALDEISQNNKKIDLIIKDSICMTSSVIGYINKLILKDGIEINTSVGNDHLLEIMDNLGLVDVFKIKKI
jgi:hypothetical protein